MNNSNSKPKKNNFIIFKNKSEKMVRFINNNSFNDAGINEDFLEEEIKLFKKCNEYAQDYIDLYYEYNKLRKLYIKKNNEINELKNELNKYSKFIRKRLVVEDDVINVKKLRNNGATYRDIELSTGWSKYTIGKILNGYYD